MVVMEVNHLTGYSAVDPDDVKRQVGTVKRIDNDDAKTVMYLDEVRITWSYLSVTCIIVANCAALPSANAGQYATLHCKPLLFRFSCKWWYVIVRTFNLC